MQNEPVTFLRNIWYSAAPSAALARGRMIHRQILGEPILIARDNAGRAFALKDLCPHRGVLLSGGQLKSAGAGAEVECPYHGWRFGADGGCTAIPSLVADQEMDISRIRVRRYPLIERQGNLWLYMASEDRADTPPTDEPPEIPAIGSAEPRFIEAMTFHCDVDHAVIGLMDPAHGPFVHRAWWWRTAKSIHEKAKAFHPTPFGFAMTSHKPSRNSFLYRLLGGEVMTEITFRLPGIRIEKISAGRHVVVGLTTVTPVTEDRTEVRQAFYWSAPWLDLIRPFFRPFAKAFLDQDRRMVDLQHEGLKHNPRLMLIDDSDMQAKWYYRLKREWQLADEERRPFQHPIKSETVLRWRS